jgi:hypothetical protein
MSAPPVVVALAKLLPSDRVDDAVQLLDKRGLAKLRLMAEEIQQIGAAATRKPLEDDRQEAAAVELVSRGVVAVKELDALRRSRVDPLNAEAKAVNSLFKIVTDPCEALVGKGGTLERLIIAYRQQKRARIEREQAEARRKQEEAARREAEALAKAEAAKTAKAREKALAEAEAASRAQAVALVETPREMPRGTRTDSGSVTSRERWTFAVQDAALVPRQYLAVDQAAIRAAVASGVRDIPGVAIYLEEALTRRVG